MNNHKLECVSAQTCNCEANQPIMGLKTQIQLEQALMNIGYDITCDECASVFYTGIGGHTHNTNCKTVSLRRR